MNQAATEIDDELASLESLYGEINSDNRDAKLAQLKTDLYDLGAELKALDEEQDTLERKAADLGKRMEEIKSDIRKRWAPFIVGTDEAILDCGDGIVLKNKITLSVKAVDTEQATDWLLHNGFKDAMKYQLHNATMKKIATEKYEKENGFEIPGIEYKHFPVVKLK